MVFGDTILHGLKLNQLITREGQAHLAAFHGCSISMFTLNEGERIRCTASALQKAARSSPCSDVRNKHGLGAR